MKIFKIPLAKIRVEKSKMHCQRPFNWYWIFLPFFEKAALQLLKANIFSDSGRNYHRVLNAEYVR